MKFSIIVPSHGDKALRAKTLQSIAAQGVEHELILVGEREDLSVSEARNQALQRAQGEYIVFCDDDDALVDGALKYLSEIIDAEAPDAIVYDYQEVKSLDTGNVSAKGTYQILNLKDAASACFAFKTLFTWMWAWNTCYRRAAIENLHFKDLLAGEDTLFGTEAMVVVDKVVKANATLYRYLQHDASVLHTPSLRQIQDGEKSILSMLEVAKVLPIFDKVRVFAYRRTRKLLVHYVFKYGARLPQNESLPAWRAFKLLARDFLVESKEFSCFSRIYYKMLLAPWFDVVVRYLTLRRLYALFSFWARICRKAWMGCRLHRG